MSDTKATGLALLREPFPAHQISKLPKPTKAQTEAVKDDYKKGHRCKVCSAWHHPDVVHLDYVGHAALTDRLLDADPGWTWEPAAVEPNGHPILDSIGGMWIKLTVCGVTRYGYGHAGDKSGGDAIKEIIGDALRNAAMRFGAALDLWHKGELHADEPKESAAEKAAREKREARELELGELAVYLIDCEQNGKQLDAIRMWYDPTTWAADSSDQNDEKTFVWGMLKGESKLRAAIKANKPEPPPKASPDVGDGDNMQ